MGTRFFDAGVLLAAILSAALLVLLLVAPALPQPSAFPPLPSTTPRPATSAEPEGQRPPIGLYLLRGAFSFGPCLALELVPQSYPTQQGAVGTATVIYWERGMTGCDARTGELQTTSADVARIADEDDPSAPPVGYAVRFTLPPLGAGQQTIAAELTILARQSTDTVLQALETAPGSGQGHVLDLVPGIDPPLNPLPSASATGETGPTGLFLMQGPLAGDVCLAIELSESSYPSSPEVPGTASVRWWNHGPAAVDDPAACLSRRGEVQLSEAVVIPVVVNGRAESRTVQFALPGSALADQVELAILDERSNEDRLVAAMFQPAEGEERVLDRVDELDPPLVPEPSPSSAP